MSAQEFLLVRTIKVGTKYQVTFSVPKGKSGDEVCCAVEWHPRRDAPLTTGELAEFRAARDGVIREIGAVAAKLHLQVEVLPTLSMH